MEVEDEAECRRKLDEQMKKKQKELREVDRLSFLSKEMQESLKESLQHQLQGVEKRRNDPMPEHQKAQNSTQKIQSYQDKRRNLQKESMAAKQDMRKLREEIERKEERFRLLFDKVGKTNGRCGDGGIASSVIGIVSPGYEMLHLCNVLNVVEIGSTDTEQGTRVSRTVGQ